MNTQSQNTRHELEQLSLPQLQTRFRDVIGESTRCPNRRFLMRRIEEALAARQEAASADSQHGIDEAAAEPASAQEDAVEASSLPMSPEADPPADTSDSVTVLDEADAPADTTEASNESTTEPEPVPQADAIEVPSTPTSEEASPQADTAELPGMPTDELASPHADTIETPAVPIADQADQQTDTIETDAVSIADEDGLQADTIEMAAVPITDEDDHAADTFDTQAEPALTADSPTPRQRGRFGSMSIEELQAEYLEAVGRPTGSTDVAYIRWKIREAEKGRITIGPRTSHERTGEPLDVKVLPLRLEAAAVERMDEAWRSRGIRSRMEFFRRALSHYLTHVGADDAAAMFAGAGND